MKNKMVYLLAFLIVIIPAAAVQAGNLCANGTVYGTYINYGGSDLKKDGWSGTAYMNLGDCVHHNVELAVAQTKINYKSQANLDQTDVTLAYTNTNQILANHIFSLGLHYINTDDALTDQGKVYFFKTTYYKSGSWNLGLELDDSDYGDSSTNLSVFQAVPHFGFYFNGLGRKLYSDTRLYYIYKNKDLGISQDNFYSLEQSLSYLSGSSDFKVSAWIGQQMFAVKNGGFVVYNLSDKYLGGLEAEAGYRLGNGLRLAANLGYQWMAHMPQNDRATQTTLVFSLGRSF